MVGAWGLLGAAGECSDGQWIIHYAWIIFVKQFLSVFICQPQYTEINGGISAQLLTEEKDQLTLQDPTGNK